MDERWQQIEEIYHAARELDRSERPAFLAKACAGDDDLRREVESLLVQAEESASFLQSPAIEVAAGNLVEGEGMSDPSRPAVELGAMIAHYRLTAKLGEGGMGEVYRARDTKLRRDVALKILPEAMAHDAERMARFEREARTLASLNHPNIAAIHGLEESNGVHALVMELVEGETLKERIGRSNASVGAGLVPAQGRPQEPPLQESLPIAKQIAEALEYAHERGVIHRDLKPANVKITPEGTAKVLDFGLAKVLSGQDSTGALDPANSPTLSTMATQAGMILGTAAYMSPEQAKGRRVDRRADIWAFGCVLYEMLAGRKAFEGETISDVLAAVIMKDPDWAAIPDTTPPSIQRLVRRCLVKEPKQRLQAIGEARITIEETLSGEEGAVVPAFGETAQGQLKGSPLKVMPWAVAAVFFALAVVLAFAYFRGSSAPVQSIRFLIPAPEKVSFAFAFGAPVLSPDGTRLVFPARVGSGKQALWVRPLDSLTAQRLEGTEGATFPFWAPDSRQLGFFQDGKLKKIDVTGGPPVLLCDAQGARGGAWSRSNIIVFSPQILGGRLSQVPAAGGTPTAIASHKGSGGAFSNRWPFFLPDGRHFLYLSGDLSAPGTSKLGIYVGELGSNEQKFLLQTDSDALYAAPGYLFFLRGNTLMGQRFDADSLKLKGGAFPVAEHVRSPQLFRLGLFSVSQTGLLVYATSGGASGGQLVWLDAKGKEIGKVGPPGVYSPRLSPDGKRLAYVRGDTPQTGDIWLMDLERGVQTRFTFGPAHSMAPVWSPDGSQIVYASFRKGGKISLHLKDSSCAGSAKRLLRSQPWNSSAPTDWSRDGRYILFQAPGANSRTATWALPLFGDRKPFPYLQTQFNESNAVFSPNGHWVAYVSDESGNQEVYLSPFPAGGGKYQVSQGGGDQLEWNRDGSALYYVLPGGKLMEASVKEKGRAVEVGVPRELFQESMASPASGRSYCVAPDGKRFLVNKAQEGASAPLTLVTNWTASLKKQ